MFRNAFRLILVFFVALFVRRVISMILAAFSEMTAPAARRSRGNLGRVEAKLVNETAPRRGG